MSIGIESEWFTWEDWTQIDDMSICYYNCTLLKEINGIPVDTKLHYINLDFEKGYIALGFDDQDEDIRCFGITMDIKEK